MSETDTPPIERKTKARKGTSTTPAPRAEMALVAEAAEVAEVAEVAKNVQITATATPEPAKERKGFARFLIPTRARVKLPYHLSFPIGAEALSESLEKAPRREILGLFFRSRPVLASAEFQRWIREQEPYPILVAEYRPALDEETKKTSVLEKLGLTEERLEIAVYPVTREVRSIANELLGDLGLVHLAKWLKSATTRVSDNTVRRIELIFSPREGTIEIREMVMA